MKKIAIVVLTVIVSGVLGVLPGIVAYAAPAISDIDISGVTENTAVISWTTDVASTGEVRYGVTPDSAPYTFTVASIGGLGTTHLVNLTGLLANTTYEYVIAATDGAETLSLEGFFTTKAFTISGISSSSITENSATITWGTLQAAAGINATSNVEYGTTPAYGSASPVVADATEDSIVHSVVLSGLTPDTVYNYKVVSINGGNTEESVNYTFQTLDSSLPVVSNVQPDSITIGTLTSATITWDTDQAADSQVEYGTATAAHGAYPSTTTLDATLVASHSVLIGGLTPDTSYFYRVISSNTYNDEAFSDEFTFTTDADTTQPVISAVASGSITNTSATITWTTDENSDSRVDYGTTVAYGLFKTSAGLVASHQIVLTDLSPGTQYHYRVRSTDVYTNEAFSIDYTFTTVADSTSPVISNISPAAQILAVDGSVLITWNTDELASSQVSWGTATGDLGSTTELPLTTVTNHSVALTGITDGATYYYIVKSVDASGNPAQSAEYSFSTLNAPTSVVKTTTNNDNTPNFTWDAITGVTVFQISVDSGVWTGVGDVVTYTIASAVTDGAHTFEVRALDSLASQGDATLVNFTIDATVPTVVTGLARVSAGNVNIPQFSWTAATDALSGVSRYQVKIDAEDWIDIANVVTYTRGTALTADGDYTLSVRAVDAAGNFGVVVTLDFTLDTVVPAVPANVAHTTDVSDSTPTFTWDAATDAASGVASYQVRIGTAAFADIGNVTTYTVAAALVPGDYTLEVRAVDAAGNTGNPVSFDFIITATAAGSSPWVIIIIVVVIAAAVAAIIIIKKKKKVVGKNIEQKEEEVEKKVVEKKEEEENKE